MRLRVGIYNIVGGGKSDRLPGLLADTSRLERLFAKIADLGCDLLGLVEVGGDHSGDGHKVSDLFALKARELGYPHNGFGVSVSGVGIVGSPTPAATGRKLYRGNMLLSRHPITRYHSFLISDFIPYGGKRDTEPRHLLLARVTLPPGDRPIYVGVTHLHTIKDRNNPCAADVRKVQCERILAIVNDLPESRTTPLLLVGDFNNNPNLARDDDREPEIRVLLRELDDLSKDSGDTRFRPADPIPGVRIDRVFGNRFIRSVQAHPDQDPLDPETEMFTHDGLPLSDHRPVVVTIDVDLEPVG